MPSYHMAETSPDAYFRDNFARPVRTTYVVTYYGTDVTKRAIASFHYSMRHAFRAARRLLDLLDNSVPLVVQVTTTDFYYYVTSKGLFRPPNGFAA